jgi:hypothetical protein
MTAASRSLATAPWGARFASGLLPQSYTTNRDTTIGGRRLKVEQQEGRKIGLLRYPCVTLATKPRG